ncbi:GGDEF domain-containing protein [Vibrio genomosp. F10]|uniref:diguanylate cyclase n=2 Tax=Vibrio genomosp. F10 TaxID=723171 RepID=A0A1B9QX39_9VIBR|nr:GGDEF domain-containing protein [Vibrio genomosp. F10]OCH74431.1 diguanylate cyclase [Vibrio genomosp. F10]OEE36672.1 diguanylate cyclase [Vibrio genomosp. F10 str. ZF-129]OEE87916.1 diguanylate cyclase [Vibrio genomosp. F10 str. 9ZD137]OEE96046.1 diguanylate cyclase [Vibrio genomosp. F10 str. 9ZC157]OEF03917.1 diguanylate cyclase [Vibrio genomosp. F10 str. 9ZB36]
MNFVHKSVLFMVVVTISTVQLYLMYGDGRVKTISPNMYAFLPTSDAANGGLSTSEVTSVGDSAVLTCEVRESDYPWPYCGISIHLDAKAENGLDFSGYHTVRLDVDLVNLTDKSHPRMRFYMRNFNPEYSSVDDEYTHKYNGIEYSPIEGQGIIEIPLYSLQVMTWWLVDNNIPIAHSAPEFSNINKIEFATGSGVGPGQYQMTINEVSLVGEFIPSDQLFISLLLMWVLGGSLLSLSEIRRNHRLINQSTARQEHLKNINRTLRAQNFQYAELAHRDALTGAMNRHAIRDWLKVQSEKCANDNDSVGILYVDIDFFKAVNDHYGHSIGDDILREFVMVIFSVIKQEHRLVRWGGEEFIVFCSSVSQAETMELAEHIRHCVENHIWVHGDPLTCSIGVSMLTNERSTEAIARADEALYLAKHLGRNRVQFIAGNQ